MNQHNNSKAQPIHPTARVYYHTQLKTVKVVDRYNNVLAERTFEDDKAPTLTPHEKNPHMQYMHGSKGKVVVNNAKGWKGLVVFRYIKDPKEVQKWINRVK